jgi:hypothetical protein
VKICPKTREPCGGKCSSGKGVVGKLKTPEGDWYMPNNLDDLLAVLGQLPTGTKYRLVAGNTSGVTPDYGEGSSTNDAIVWDLTPSMLTYSKIYWEALPLNFLVEHCFPN